MKEMLILLGAMAPIELLLDHMDEAVKMAKAELASGNELSEKSKGQLSVVSTMMMTRIATGGDSEKTVKMMEEMEKTQKAKDLISPSQQ